MAFCPLRSNENENIQETTTTKKATKRRRRTIRKSSNKDSGSAPTTNRFGHIRRRRRGLEQDRSGGAGMMREGNHRPSRHVHPLEPPGRHTVRVPGLDRIAPPGQRTAPPVWEVCDRRQALHERLPPSESVERVHGQIGSQRFHGFGTIERVIQSTGYHPQVSQNVFIVDCSNDRVSAINYRSCSLHG